MKSVEELSVEFMKEYLKHVVELETNIYTQEIAIQDANHELELNRPQKKEIEIPSISKVEVPQIINYTKHSGEDDAVYKAVKIGASIYAILMGVAALILAIAFNTMWIAFFSVPLLGIGFYYGLTILKKIKENKEKQQLLRKEYQGMIETYNIRQEAAEKEYDSEMQLYRCAVQTEERRYTAAKKNYAQARKEVNMLKAPLTESKKLLSRLYDKNIIFPKYRNIVAMCTIYEYFLSGRCIELTGPNGAYNLYEAELRQNMIINQLDEIRSHLEDIKENQYTLYHEMQRANKTIVGIANDIDKILKKTQNISNDIKKVVNNTHITACCAQAVSYNTEVLKYINLIN